MTKISFAYPSANRFGLCVALFMLFYFGNGDMNAYGQQSLNYADDPHFGTVRLSAGFDTDPHTVRVSSGGSINVSSLRLCAECEGHASQAPDVRLDWSGNSSNLRVYFEADDPSQDATLIISTPDGTWIGNDDGGSNTLNPMLSLSRHGAGQYDIWVGSYAADKAISDTLTITELNTTPSNTPASSGQRSLDYDEDPHFGEATLSRGFQSDPYTVRVTSGGSVDVSALNLCSDCTGYASVAPDFRLHYNGNPDDLRIFFEAKDGSEDATLIISTPDGTWIGNDDGYSNTLNPMLDLDGRGSGQYDIWVGSYESGKQIEGTLTITELDRQPAASGSSSSTPTLSLNYELEPHFGEISLSAGFSSDPHTVRVTSGGSVDVSGLGLCSSCTGYASRAPDLRLTYTGDPADLRIFFEAENADEDATLIISTPDGTWIGNDDSHSGTVNPMLLLHGHGSGQYDIWVGSYSADKEIRGVVTITEYARKPR